MEQKQLGLFTLNHEKIGDLKKKVKLLYFSPSIFSELKHIIVVYFLFIKVYLNDFERQYGIVMSLIKKSSSLRAWVYLN